MYEYKNLIVRANRFDSRQVDRNTMEDCGFNKIMNDLATEGWRLFQVVDLLESNWVQFVFERKVEE